MIKINSYKDINGIGFGSNEANVIAALGEPLSRRKNQENEQELHFSDCVFRFEASSGCMREVTLLPKCVAEINGTPVAWSIAFLHWLAREDSELKEALGFVLSLKLGVAVSGFHDGDESQRAIHAFNRGDWDIFQRKMRPFSVT